MIREWLVDKWWSTKEWWWDREPAPVVEQELPDVEGKMRFNGTTNEFEVFTKGEWVVLNTECPYCMDKVLGEVYYDQNCLGCIRRMENG